MLPKNAVLTSTPYSVAKQVGEASTWLVGGVSTWLKWGVSTWLKWGVSTWLKWGR